MKYGVDKIEYGKDKIIVTGTTEIGKLKGVWKYREQPIIENNCNQLNKGSFASFAVRYEDIWIYPYD